MGQRKKEATSQPSGLPSMPQGRDLPTPMRKVGHQGAQGE